MIITSNFDKARSKHHKKTLNNIGGNDCKKKTEKT